MAIPVKRKCFIGTELGSECAQTCERCLYEEVLRCMGEFS
jgi:hypothetical protein